MSDHRTASTHGIRPSDVRIPVTREEAEAALSLARGKVKAVGEQIADLDADDANRRPAAQALARWNEKLGEIEYAMAKIAADEVVYPEDRARLLERMGLTSRSAPQDDVGRRLVSLQHRLSDAKAFSILAVRDLIALADRSVPLADALLRSFGREVGEEQIARWDAKFRAVVTRSSSTDVGVTP